MASTFETSVAQSSLGPSQVRKTGNRVRAIAITPYGYEVLRALEQPAQQMGGVDIDAIHFKLGAVRAGYERRSTRD